MHAKADNTMTISSSLCDYQKHLRQCTDKYTQIVIEMQTNDYTSSHKNIPTSIHALMQIPKHTHKHTLSNTKKDTISKY